MLYHAADLLRTASSGMRLVAILIKKCQGTKFQILISNLNPFETRQHKGDTFLPLTSPTHNGSISCSSVSGVFRPPSILMAIW